MTPASSVVSAEATGLRGRALRFQQPGKVFDHRVVRVVSGLRQRALDETRDDGHLAKKTLQGDADLLFPRVLHPCLASEDGGLKFLAQPRSSRHRWLQNPRFAIRLKLSNGR
jgi:hypothetical protein